MGVKLLVFGIGNTLRMDDGIGVYLVRELENYFDKEEIKIYEIGTETWRLFSIIEEEECENVVIVDAINLNFIPGFVYLSKNPEIKDFCSFSLHEKNYLSEIDFEFLPSKNIYIFGIEPYKTDWGIGLSEILKKKFNEILEKLVELCNSIIKKEKKDDLLGIETL
ncbi:MAG: hydrogenase maturation protease [Candidatus Omnitrophica bacterium]|nr:hydrogenase maturation protease [Candidatus Omnitrophota bacterium]MCM8807509.1 hydrogenase maturation protease [Candidatus Omnitrophota bacterium]